MAFMTDSAYANASAMARMRLPWQSARRPPACVNGGKAQGCGRPCRAGHTLLEMLAVLSTRMRLAWKGAWRPPACVDGGKAQACRRPCRAGHALLEMLAMALATIRLAWQSSWRPPACVNGGKAQGCGRPCRAGHALLEMLAMALDMIRLPSKSARRPPACVNGGKAQACGPLCRAGHALLEMLAIAFAMLRLPWKSAWRPPACVNGGKAQACRRPCRAGHTLLEMLAVLSIAALLMAAALPSLQHMLARQQVRAAATDLFSAIELTRAQAMARGQRVLLMPAGPGGMDWRTGWLVFIDRNASLAFDDGDELLFRQGPLAAGITVQFAFSSATAPLYIAYNGAGRSCSATNSLAARWGTLSLILGKQLRHIKINMLGRVRVCDPQQQAANCSGVADSS